jgi:S-formylglutathione hydrolase FrmB
MVRAPSRVVLALGLLGCARGAPQRPAQAVASPARSDALALTLRLPHDGPAEGSLIALAYTAAESAAGAPDDPAHFVQNLGRIEVVHGLTAVAGVIHGTVHVAARLALLRIFFDTHHEGLEAVMGPRPGIYLGEVPVPADATRAEGRLAGLPYAPAREACEGPRTTLVTLDDPGTQTPDDSGPRRLCVYVPRSYDASASRRYPVVFAFPGFSGWHAGGDAWRERALFDDLGAELGVEAIVVGVGTRTPEGSSYLQRSARFGDWDGFVAARMVAAVDQRFRTLPRRGTLGHSTGGWNALAAALQHPEVFTVAAASSPDAPDLDAWLLDGTALRPRWLSWLRAEARLGGRGQFVSYAAAWSPDPSQPRGFAWPVDLADGALRPDVYARWRGASLAEALRTETGLRNARTLSGRIAVTVGRADEFGLFEPSERYVEALRAAGVAVTWLPTALGHFRHGPARFGPLVRFLLAALR